MVFPEGTNRDLVSVTLYCERPSIADIGGLHFDEDIKVVAIIRTKPIIAPGMPGRLSLPNPI